MSAALSLIRVPPWTIQSGCWLGLQQTTVAARIAGERIAHIGRYHMILNATHDSPHRTALRDTMRHPEAKPARTSARAL
jgi:hypothetical protein